MEADIVVDLLSFEPSICLKNAWLSLRFKSYMNW